MNTIELEKNEHRRSGTCIAKFDQNLICYNKLIKLDKVLDNSLDKVNLMQWQWSYLKNAMSTLLME